MTNDPRLLARSENPPGVASIHRMDATDSLALTPASQPATLIAEASYLRGVPSLPPDLAQLAEESDDRPLLTEERQRLTAAIAACAVAVRLARPPMVQAALDGRLPEQADAASARGGDDGQ